MIFQQRLHHARDLSSRLTLVAAPRPVCTARECCGRNGMHAGLWHTVQASGQGNMAARLHCARAQARWPRSHSPDALMYSCAEDLASDPVQLLAARCKRVRAACSFAFANFAPDLHLSFRFLFIWVPFHFRGFAQPFQFAAFVRISEARPPCPARGFKVFGGLERARYCWLVAGFLW